ncbi:MAG TPA: beta-glucosidase, partial [Pseudomonas sp.]|nr:beta-glucosidase [Pseudomonas sp.]
LFGDYNPSGKLPVTFVRNVGQIPLYYNHLNTGRPFDPINPAPYRSRHFDVDDTPLFPFGFGLSYTQFDVSAPRLSTDRLRPGERLKVRVTVTNQGPLAGETTVQLYLRDLSASVSRPVKELKGFQNIFLEPGAARDLTLEIAPTALAFVDRNLQWVTEPGNFEVMVGLDSHHVKTATFERLP